MKKIISAVLAVVFCLGMLTGCGKEKAFPITVGGVTLEKAPERVVVLSPNIAVMAVRLGHADDIVGICEDNQNPTSMKNVPTVGTAAAPDVAAITDLKADLVITFLAPNDRDLMDLQKAGAAVAVLTAPTDYDTLNTYYTDLASCFEGVLPEDHKAHQYKKDLDSWMTALAEKSDERPSFAILATPKLVAAGGDTMESKLFSSVLGQNIFAEDSGYVQDLERLIQSDPEVLIVTDALNFDLLKSTHGFAELSAVENGRVYFVTMKNFELFVPDAFQQVCDVATKVYAGSDASAE